MEANALTPPADSPGFAAIQWLKALALGAVALGVYLANGHDIGTEDTQPTTLVPHAIARGDGLNLKRFAEVLAPDGEPLACVAWKRGQLVTRFPVATGVLATPLIWPQRMIYDRVRPGWRSHPLVEWRFALDLGKHAAAIIAALTVACIYRLLQVSGLGRAAFVSTLAVALGSGLWTTASQALWQHGPATLSLVTAMLLLSQQKGQSRIRHITAGVCTGLMCAVRLVDGVFAAAMFFWLLRARPTRVAWFVLGMLPVVGLTVAHNIWWFGTPMGGQAELDSLHPAQHAIAGAWNLNVVPGLAGTLFSPSRGLFVFMPWVLVALAVYPWSRSELARSSLGRWMALSLAPYLLALSAYGVWWGGFCYGPRYWTDAAPIFALLFGSAWQWAGRGKLWLHILLITTVLWAVALQTLGAFCYPSSWNLNPANIDTHHERLWDWADTEVSRCIREKMLK